MATDAWHVVSTLHALSPSSFASQEDRMRVLKATQRLFHRLEAPYETAIRLSFQDPAYEFALNTASSIRLWQHLDSSPKSTEQLAAATGCEQDLLGRILRHLSTKGTVTERGEHSWSASDLSRALIDDDARTITQWGMPYMNKIYYAAPAFFKDNGYVSPNNGANTLYQYAFDCKDTPVYDFLRRDENKDDSRAFNLMHVYAARFHPSWLDMGPTAAWFEDASLGLDASAVAVVDIGGALSIDLAKFRKRYPRSKMPARAISQDLPAVIEEGKAKGNSVESKDLRLDEVELQAHDFFEPQPIQGARIYYLSNILLGWPDDSAKKILMRTAQAMKKSFCKLLISEPLIPRTGCKAQPSALDLVMMTWLGSKLRTMAEWEDLLKSQGLKVTAVHDLPTAYKSILEIELV